MQDLSDLASAFRKAAPYINSTYVIIAAVALFGLLGYWLDTYTDTAPLFFIIGLFLGMITGFYNFFKVIQQLNREP